MRPLALVALVLAFSAPAFAATPTGGASHGQLKVGFIVTDAKGRVPTAVGGPARAGAKRLAPRITRETENGSVFTLVYY
jgi:hypothetical protein